MNSSANRTPTSNQTTFNLTRPDLVIFDFSKVSTVGLRITIPTHSGWFAQSHWHETTLACETLEPLEGCFMISHSFVTTRNSGNVIGDGGKGFLMPLKPNLMVKWQRDPHQATAEREIVVFGLTGSKAVFNLYRQVCSVNQDAELYFLLVTTPLWLRALYAFWAWIPYIGTRVRTCLVTLLLWVQLRVIYYKDDFLVDEGRIPYTWPWWDLPGAQKPPEKWIERELKSRVMISNLIQKWCYWVGTTILGMKEWYEEYSTPEYQDLKLESK